MRRLALVAALLVVGAACGGALTSPSTGDGGTAANTPCVMTLTGATGAGKLLILSSFRELRQHF